jgi:hypothetical protein
MAHREQCEVGNVNAEDLLVALCTLKYHIGNQLIQRAPEC